MPSDAKEKPSRQRERRNKGMKPGQLALGERTMASVYGALS